MLKESKLYKNYATNEDGSYVININNGNIMKPYLGNSGYLFVGGIPLHRIIASAFKYEYYFDKATVDHIDGDKFNNHISNLEWVTQSENEIRSYKNGRKGVWSDKDRVYPKEGRVKQSLKIIGSNNPSAKKRIIICDDGDIFHCGTRKDIIDKIYCKYGVKYSMSNIKSLIKKCRNNKLGFNIIEGQSTIESID